MAAKITNDNEKFDFDYLIRAYIETHKVGSNEIVVDTPQFNIYVEEVIRAAKSQI